MLVRQIEDAISGGKMQMRGMHPVDVRIHRRGFRRMREALDGKVRKGPRYLGEQARAFRCSGGTKQLRRCRQLAVEVPGLRMGFVQPMRKKDGRDDQVQHEDRSDHERRDLSADRPEIQKAERRHGQRFAANATASTRGVKM